MTKTQTWLKEARAAKNTLKNAARLFKKVSAGYADARDAAAAKNNVKESIDAHYSEVAAAHKSVCALHAGGRRTRRFRR
jgi:translation initiation factor 2B subunit (eIF-2B alpha/beta/delta family)